MATKSLAFFSDCTVELPSPIFVGPKVGRRGRRPERDLFFPNGERRPGRDELIQFIVDHVLYQIDPGSDGPIFCKHVIERAHRERNKQSMYHVVLGPPALSGVWEIVGNRRMFDVRAVYLPQEATWIPQIVLSPGNYIGVANLNGVELSPSALASEMLRRGFATPEDLDRYYGGGRQQRERAIRYAYRGIWM
jgi:hypothetical protein